MRIFGVFHKYDTDGGFGDAITQKDLICIFDSLEKAEEFKKKYENPHVYDSPYADLECGELVIEELPTTYDESRFWWIGCGDYEGEEDFEGFEDEEDEEDFEDED